MCYIFYSHEGHEEITVSDIKTQKRKSLRLPSAGESFRGRSPELKELRDAFLEKGIRAVGIHGGAGMGKTSLAVKFAESLPEEFDYALSFECRGGIKAEEIVFRLCQFLDYHDIGSFQNIILSPIPLELKIEFLSKFLSRTKLLLVFDEIDSSIAPEHGQLTIGDPSLRDSLSSLIAQSNEGTRFIFTSTSRFSLPVEHMTHLEISEVDGRSPLQHRAMEFLAVSDISSPGPDGLMKQAIGSLDSGALSALKNLSAYEKAVPLTAVTQDPVNIEPLLGCGLAGTFKSGDQDMLTIHTLAREHMRESLPREQWKELTLRAAAFRETYGRETGVIWHMIYAHDLYAEAMDFQKAAEITSEVSPTLLSWGQMGLAYEINLIAAQSAEGELRAKALYNVGSIEMGRSEYEKAMENLESGLALFESLNDSAGISNVLIQIASIHNNRGRLDKALEAYQRALRLKEELEDKDSVSLILNRLAQIYLDSDQQEKAIDTFKRSAEMSSGTESSQPLMLALEKLGGLHASRGEVDEAIDAYERGIETLDPRKDPNSMTRALNRLGGLYFRKGDAGKALEYLKRSLKYSELTRNKELSAINLLEMGRVYFELKDYRAAISNTIISLALFDASSSESKSAALELLGHMEKELGQDEFSRLNEEIMKELREKGPTPG